MKAKFVFSCCFCGKGIAKKGTDPVSVCIGHATDEDAFQTFYGHLRCFKKAMKPEFHDDLMEDLGGPKIDWSKIKPVPREKWPKFLQ